MLPSLALLIGMQATARPAPHVEPASEEATQAIQRFTAASGIAVELFAAEPRLANPVSFCIDHGGDVYVAEAFRILSGVTDIRRHMDWLDDDLAAKSVADRVAYTRKWMGAGFEGEYATAAERVRCLRDTDGDHIADEDHVFADGFDDPAAGIGAGLLSYGGDVYYTCIPDLWKLRDTDGDGVADERAKLSSGYGVHIALYGHDLHGLRIGPDRRLYFSVGDRGFRVETKEGRVIDHVLCGAVLRCELDGTKLEVWHTGLRNPQELVFDEYGDLWTGDNNSDGGDRARWVHVVEGGDSGWRYPYQWITAPVARGPWNDEKLWHPAHAGQAAYIVPPVANLGDGPAGLTYYPGTGLSSAYSGHFFLCDFRGDAVQSGIHTFTVERKGASFALGPVDWFLRGALVTDCDFGPDGALWFSDWVYGWEQTGKGRLYRCVVPGTAEPALVTETRELLARGMKTRSVEELAKFLGHPDQRVRQEAHFELAERGEVDALTRVALEVASPRARLHAIWGLGILGRRDPGVLDRLLRPEMGREPEIRAQVLRVIGDARWAGGVSAVATGLADGDARVRSFAALAAGRLRIPELVPLLADVLRAAGEGDRDLRHAAVMGLAGCADLGALERLAVDPSSDVRMGALLVLRRAKDSSIARFLRDADPRLVLEAARAIHDLPIEDALEALARMEIRAEDLAAGERALVRRVLNAAYRLGRADLLANHAENAVLPVEARVEALDMLARWEEPSPRDRVTNEWRPLERRSADGLAEIADRLAEGPVLADVDAVVAEFAHFAGAVRATKAAGALAGLVAAPKRGSTVKIAALEALEALGAAELVPSVRTALADVDGRVRAAALERLARLAPEEVVARVPELAATGEIAERRAAYRILAERPEPAAAETLSKELAKLEQELVPAELALDLVEASSKHGAPELAAVLARRSAARAGRDPALTPYLDALFGGDAARGSDVFQRVELSCTRCHAWWPDAAERVGPDLAGVGKRLTRLQILESIVGPNRRTTPGFGARAFFLKDGRVVSGRVVEENEALVRLFDASNNPLALAREDIDEERTDLSAMPEDLAKSLTPAEMRDLLEYLAAL